MKESVRVLLTEEEVTEKLMNLERRLHAIMPERSFILYVY